MAGAKGGDLNANASTSSWAASAAESLDSEYSCVGYGRQGWTIHGNGHVPPFCDAWRSLWAGVPRSFRYAPSREHPPVNTAVCSALGVVKLTELRWPPVNTLPL